MQEYSGFNVHGVRDTICRFIDNAWIKFYDFAVQSDCKPQATASIIQWNAKIHIETYELKLAQYRVYVCVWCLYILVCTMLHGFPLEICFVASRAHRVSTLIITHMHARTQHIWPDGCGFPWISSQKGNYARFSHSKYMATERPITLSSPLSLCGHYYVFGAFFNAIS